MKGPIASFLTGRIPNPVPSSRHVLPCLDTILLRLDITADCQICVKKHGESPSVPQGLDMILPCLDIFFCVQTLGVRLDIVFPSRHDWSGLDTGGAMWNGGALQCPVCLVALGRNTVSYYFAQPFRSILISGVSRVVSCQFVSCRFAV